MICIHIFYVRTTQLSDILLLMYHCYCCDLEFINIKWSLADSSVSTQLKILYVPPPEFINDNSSAGSIKALCIPSRFMIDSCKA